MSKISINVVSNGSDPVVYVNIYDPSATSIALLFKKKYEETLLDILSVRWGYPTKAIAGDVVFSFDKFDGRFWTWTYCPLGKINDLLQVFADEELKTKIMRKVFEHV